MNIKYCFKSIIFIFGIFLLLGCHGLIIHPAGIIAEKQHRLLFISFLTMLIIVIPVMCMILFFVYFYRSSKNNIYRPEWKHSNIIELIVWIIPILIIIFLSFLTWQTSHSLDPKKHIISTNKPITINVVALDWQWLFIYPKENIATINELIIPVNTPIIFNITSNSVMSSFFIPDLGSQVYAMPKMISNVNLLAKHPGQYLGFSANYNGSGFSDMKFNTIVLPNKQVFNKFVHKIQHVSCTLNTFKKFKIIAHPSVPHNIQYFSHVDPDLFNNIIMYVI